MKISLPLGSVWSDIMETLFTFGVAAKILRFMNSISMVKSR